MLWVPVWMRRRIDTRVVMRRVCGESDLQCSSCVDYISSARTSWVFVVVLWWICACFVVDMCLFCGGYVLLVMVFVLFL